MFDRRTLAAALVLPAVVLLDGLAWFGMSSVLYLYLSDLALPIEDYSRQRVLMSGVGLVATLASGVLAIAVGPRVMMALGLFVAGVGLVSCNLVPPELTPLLAARLAGDQHTRLVTLVMALWLGISGSGYLVTSWWPALHEPPLSRGVVGGGAVLAVLVGLVLVAAAFPLRRHLVPRVDPDDTPQGGGADDRPRWVAG